MALITALSLLLLIVSGCSTRSRIKESQLLELKSAPAVAAVHHSAPLFSLILPGPSVRTGLGMFFGSGGRGGMSAGVSIGGNKEARPAPELAAQFSLKDPALEVKDAFVRGLRETLGFRNIRPEGEAMAEHSVSSLREKYGSTAVVDFRTELWALSAYSSKQKYYDTPFKVRARIVMPAGRGVIWENTCSYKRKKSDKSPTYEKVTAGKGALMRRMLSEAANYCARELLGKLKDYR
jgi:hypothetical protein